MKLLIGLFVTICCIVERNQAFLSGIKKLANKVTGADNAEKLSQNVMGTANNKYVPKLQPLLWKILNRELAAQDIEPNNFVEGDIRNDDFVKAVRSGSASKRAGTANTKWDKRIPYMFDGSMTASKKAVVMNAIKDLEDYTCLKFVTPGAEDKDYLNFVKDGKKCWSHVGRVGGKQDISIGSGCGFKGTVIHEIMHALGFFHEHTRPVRDKYIKVNLENVKTDKRDNFKIHESNAIIAKQQDSPYDYYSIMHLGQRAFGKDAGLQKTIIPLDASVSSDELGQRSGLSNIDIQRISNAYCNEKATTTAATGVSTSPSPKTEESATTTKSPSENPSSENQKSKEDDDKQVASPTESTETMLRSTQPADVLKISTDAPITSTKSKQKQFDDAAGPTARSSSTAKATNSVTGKASASSASDISSSDKAKATVGPTISSSASATAGPTSGLKSGSNGSKAGDDDESKTGSSGSKTGDAGSKTGDDGSKTGDSGSKTGDTGSKTGDSESTTGAIGSKAGHGGSKAADAASGTAAPATQEVTKVIPTVVTEVVSKIVPTVVTSIVTIPTTITKKPTTAKPTTKTTTTAAPCCLPAAPAPAPAPAPAAPCCQQQPQCTTNNGYPCWPQDFTWSNNGLPSSCNCNTAAPSCRCNCVKIEGAKKNPVWSNNFLCYKDKEKNPSLRWSTKGTIPNMKCVKVTGSNNTDGWDNNYLCSKKAAPYNFFWSFNGKDDKSGECLQIDEPEEKGWGKNFLCA